MLFYISSDHRGNTDPILTAVLLLQQYLTHKILSHMHLLFLHMHSDTVIYMKATRWKQSSCVQWRITSMLNSKQSRRATACVYLCVQYVRVQSSLLCEGVRVFVRAYYLKGHSLFTGGTVHLFRCELQLTKAHNSGRYWKVNNVPLTNKSHKIICHIYLADTFPTALSLLLVRKLLCAYVCEFTGTNIIRAL